MTPEVLSALRRIVDELGADAGVLVRLSADGSAVVTSSTMAPAVRVGDDWADPGPLGGTGGGPQLVVEPERLAALVPTAARPVLGAPVTAALVAPVADTLSRLVLLYARSSPPPDVIGRLEAGSFARFALLAPLLDAQVQAEEAASRLRTVVAALDQAIVFTATGGGGASINVAAAQLLGLRPGWVDPAALTDALRALRDRAVDPVVLAAELDRILADPTASGARLGVDPARRAVAPEGDHPARRRRDRPRADLGVRRHLRRDGARRERAPGRSRPGRERAALPAARRERVGRGGARETPRAAWSGCPPRSPPPWAGRRPTWSGVRSATSSTPTTWPRSSPARSGSAVASPSPSRRDCAPREVTTAG